MKHVIKIAWLAAAQLLLAGALLLGGASGSALFAQTSGSTLSPEAQQAMRRGRDAAKRQEWKLAIKYFGQARKAAPMSPHALFNLAVANDKAGRREHFAIAWYRAYLASAPDATNAGQVRDRIAKLEVQLEANARDLIRKAKVINLRAWSSIGKLSEAQVEVGDFAGAMETLEQIPPEHRALGYTDIAYAQARAGDIAEAMETASRITNPFFRGKAYIPIAEEQAWSGNIAGAKATASRITYWGQKNEAYSIIAKAQAKAGDKSGSRKSIAQAQKFAAGIKDEDDKRKAYIRVAEAQAYAGDFAGAKATAARFIDTEFHWPFFTGDDRSRTYEYIALKQAKAGDIAGAWETTTRIISEDDKSIAYSAIAKLQAKAGDITGARESIARAREIAARIKSENLDKVRAYIGIAEKQAEAGDITGARELIAQAQESAARLKSDSERGWADRKIAELEEAVELKAHWNDEIEDWTELVGSFIGAFMGSWAEDDFQRFVEDLKNKENNDDIAYDLTQAAVGYAKALLLLRNMEAKWQKRRAGAAR